MRTHYIYLEDKIVDEIPAKSREQARKLFIEKYKEINGDSEVPKVVVTVRKRQTKKRSTFHVSPDIYNLIERHRSEDNISISQYIATVIDELISGKYDYAFDFEGEKDYKSVAVFQSDFE
ncbi:TPA: molybdenum ABC transporter ATP-binding protein, partial [Enterococcus faecium]|nr:molybdenum ABC transporter ATP-binding protein [Enterococcus faecium]